MQNSRSMMSSQSSYARVGICGDLRRNLLYHARLSRSSRLFCPKVPKG
jgi:hypothetical protein